MSATVEQRVIQRPKKLVKNAPVYETDLSKTKLELSWKMIIIFIVLHIGGLYGLFLRSGISIYTGIFVKISMFFTLFGIIGGHHRLWSHRSYKASTFLQILLVIAVSGTYQYSIYHWVKDHRVHHKYTETNADPHNSKRGLFYSHIGWLLVKKQTDVIKGGKEIDFSDLENNPIIMFQHKYYHYFILIFTIVLPTFIPWYFWGETIKHTFFTCVLYKFILLLHFAGCGTSLLHSFGRQTYNKKIKAYDNPIGHIVTLGDGFHNFHHTFPSDYRSGEFALDFRNLTGMIIFMFHKLGLAYDLKETPKALMGIWADKYGDHCNDCNKDIDNYLSKGLQDFITQLKYFLFQLLFIYVI